MKAFYNGNALTMQNRFYEEGGKGLIFKKAKVTEAERKRAEALWKELTEELTINNNHLNHPHPKSFRRHKKKDAKALKLSDAITPPFNTCCHAVSAICSYSRSIRC